MATAASAPDAYVERFFGTGESRQVVETGISWLAIVQLAKQNA
jgi:hypothetical protein